MVCGPGEKSKTSTEIKPQYPISFSFLIMAEK